MAHVTFSFGGYEIDVERRELRRAITKQLLRLRRAPFSPLTLRLNPQACGTALVPPAAAISCLGAFSRRPQQRVVSSVITGG
jgi:hypothetical protein